MLHITSYLTQTCKLCSHFSQLRVYVTVTLYLIYFIVFILSHVTAALITSCICLVAAAEANCVKRKIF